MKNSVKIFLAISSILISCKNSENLELIQKSLNDQKYYMHSTQLINSIEVDYKDRILSADIIDSNKVIIATLNNFGLYDFEGNIIWQQENEVIQSENEFYKPVIRTSNNLIYHWCNKICEFRIFDEEGSKIHSFRNFKHGEILDFLVYGKLVCFYLKDAKDCIIKIYDIEKQEYIFSAGEPSLSHCLLSDFENVGGMTIVKNTLYFLTIDKLDLYAINLNDLKESRLEIKDNRFKSVNKNLKKFENANSNPISLFEFASNSSYTLDLFNNNGIITIKALVGESKINRMTWESDDSNRYILFYLLFPDGSQKSTIQRLNNLDLISAPQYLPYNNILYSILAYEYDNNRRIKYKIIQMDLKSTI